MQERVQLNISVTREQKLALQALAEGYGTSVTKLVLGLIDQGVASTSSPTVAAEREEIVEEAFVEVAPDVISSPAEVPAVLEKALAVSPPARAFTPYSKEEQVGKAAKKAKARAHPPKSTPWPSVEPCRHGLLRCKVCGTG